MILESKPLASDPFHTYLILSMQYIPLDSKISRWIDLSQIRELEGKKQCEAVAEISDEINASGSVLTCLF